MKRRDLITALEKAGFKLVRNNRHSAYRKPGGPTVWVPNHRELNEITARAILKAAGLA